MVQKRNAKWLKACVHGHPYECKLTETCLQLAEIWESQLVLSRLIKWFFLWKYTGTHIETFRFALFPYPVPFVCYILHDNYSRV